MVLSVARMYPRKRLADLLHAAALLRTRVAGVQVRIVGRGPEWDALSRLHAELGLGDTVVLLGDLTRERLAEEYVNASVFCLPSVQEGFGIVFLEAMAAELPVVACRVAAVPEVVLDGATGLLVPPRDPGALAEALERLIREPALARAPGAGGAPPRAGVLPAARRGALPERGTLHAGPAGTAGTRRLTVPWCTRPGSSRSRRATATGGPSGARRRTRGCSAP